MFITLDIDECDEELGTCSQSCTNTDGSYTCNCTTGYTLNNDGQTCNGKSDVIIRINLLYAMFRHQ